MSRQVADRLYQIFSGRTDAYGQDVDKDGIKGKGGMRVDAPYTAELVRKHLRGEIGIGVYPTWHTDDGVLMCSWGCCDIDTGDWDEAYALAAALRAMGMVPHIERSRSKGWHVWIFPTQPVQAWEMRRALKVAYAAIELPAKEANPKSEQLKPHQVGNYVRLPYKGAMATNWNEQRQTFMKGWNAKDDGVPVGPTDWVYEIDQTYFSDAANIMQWATRYKEPERKHIVDMDMLEDSELASVVNSLPGDLSLFVKNGPQRDRSGGLVALAYKLRSQGYTAKEIYGVIVVAHEIWGSKYANHHNPEQYLLEIVERVVQ